MNLGAFLDLLPCVIHELSSSTLHPPSESAPILINVFHKAEAGTSSRTTQLVSGRAKMRAQPSSINPLVLPSSSSCRTVEVSGLGSRENDDTI